MRNEKLDAALQSALSRGDSEALHTVFVHTEPELPESAQGMLAGFEARLAAPSSGIYTAELTGDEIDRLSEEDWVRQVRLGRQLRPMS